jgi:hypothetical protein
MRGKPFRKRCTSSLSYTRDPLKRPKNEAEGGKEREKEKRDLHGGIA